jgi:integrase
MPRPANPLGDPVAIRRKGDVYKVRFYPTGVITKPSDRKELRGTFPNKEAASAAATLLRTKLVEHRNRYLPGADRGCVMLSTVAAEFVRANREASEASDLAVGTYRRIASDMRVYIEPVVEHGDVPVKALAGALAETICSSVSKSKKKDGTYKAENTVAASQTTLRNFGAWLVSAGYLGSDPFSVLSGTSEERTNERKQRARRVAVAQTANAAFHMEDDAEAGLGLKDVPSLAVVSALSDAIFRRESGSATVPNSRLAPLAVEVARQLAAMPLFRTATGLRHCETLAVHSSRIDLDNLTVGVDRQLLRAPSWLPGQAPQLAPPKHNRRRTAHVWPMFADRLRELVEWADANTGGWLFAPPRADRWWTENCDAMWDRAVDLLAYEHAINAHLPDAERPPQWTWKPHYTRHAYGSYSLAPRTSGGLGWSLTMVSRSMGHANEATTERVYRHAISDELLNVKTATIEWPGL